MFSSACVYSKIVVHILTNRKCALQHEHAAIAVQRQFTRTSGTLESLRPPHHYKKKVVSQVRVKYMFVTRGKVHFCDQKCPLPAFTCRKRHFENPIWAILAAFIRIMGPKTPPTLCQNELKSPKNGVWGLFGPFGGHFYPFYIDFRRNKK